MQRIPRESAMEYVFDAHTRPVLRVKPGESFTIETEDAFSGLLRCLEDVKRSRTFRIKQTVPGLGNPMGGPIFVEGARKGDTLEVRIEKITVDPVGRTMWTPAGGPLRESRRWPALAEHFYHEIRHLPGASGTTRDGIGVLNEHARWNLAPFIGTIGVAPEVEVTTSAVGQGPWGGNLDCRDMKEGTVVQIPVYHDGALLYAGDVHASQGDTEFYGAADETRAEVTLSCTLLPGRKLPYLRLVKPDSFVSLYCFRPLEQAVQTAVEMLMAWMIDEHGVSPEEAYMHATVNPDFRVNVYQMVRIDPIQYTAGAEIPRKYVEGRKPRA